MNTPIEAICGIDKRYYIFKGKQYCRKDVGEIVTGPKDIKGNWGKDEDGNELDGPFNAVCGIDTRYYFFRGRQYWRKNVGSDELAGPTVIKGNWGTDERGYELDGPFDAVCAVDGSRYYFFKGFQYWEKKVGSEKLSGPKPISGNWGVDENGDELDGPFDAVCNIEGDRYYLFKGDLYWRKTVGDNRLIGPRDIEGNWGGLILSTWMENNLNLIGSKSLHEIVIPGSHDAGMYEASVVSTDNTRDLAENAELELLSDCWAKTQSNTIYEQLQCGIRYFDLRPKLHFGTIRIYHGEAYGPKLRTVLQDVEKFINGSKSEIVILEFSHMEVDEDLLIAQVIDEIGGILYIKDDGERLANTSINDLVKRGGNRRVIAWLNYGGAKAKPEVGIYNRDHLTVYNKYANTNDLEKMIKDQFEKLDDKENHQKDLFTLSWTLTMQGLLPPCIKELAEEANSVLKKEISEHPMVYTPNIMFVDYCDTFVTTVCLWLNRNVLQ